jgi:DNA-binding IclR family transcriptional regulator
MEKQGGQSIQRAIAIIRTVAKYESRGCNLKTIANELDLHVATAHRILGVLAGEGFIIHDRGTKFYHIGLELINLTIDSYFAYLLEYFRSTLKGIAQKTEDTVFLIIRSGYEALCIDRVEGTFPIRALTVDVGGRVPLGIGAGALALLSFISDKETQAIISAIDGRYTEFGNLKADDIRARVKTTRKLGYALSSSSRISGTTGVGLPIYDSKGNILAAISVAAVDQRMLPERHKDVAKIIQKEINRLGDINVT